MTRTARPLASLLTLGLLVTPATAQERLTLGDAQGRAVAASHRLAETRARQAAAEAAIDVRAAADRPVVSVSAGYTRTNHVTEFVVPSPLGAPPRILYPDVPDNYRTRLDLQWPIYTGGRTGALERAARAEAAAVAAEVAAAQADLRLEVARAFWALVTADATVGVLTQAVERAGSNVRDVRERLAAGLVPPNEVASAEAQESRQRMLLIEARNQRDLSNAELARLMGLDPAVASFQAEVPAAETAPVGVPRRPERDALARRIEAAESLQAAAAAGARPTVAIISGIDYARPNPRIFPRADRWDESWDVGANVAWSLWDGGRTRAEMAQAVAMTSAARSRLQDFESLVALEVRQRELEIASGRAAMEAAADAIRAAREAQRVVGERYRAGVATQADVLDADLALLQAQLDATRAQSGVRFAEARLQRALGR